MFISPRRADDNKEATSITSTCNIFSIKLNKIGSSPFNNKRSTLSNGCVTLTYGRNVLRQDNLDQHDQELNYYRICN